MSTLDSRENPVSITLPELPLTVPRPVGSRILVEPVDPPKQSKGGILLTDDTQQGASFMMGVGRVVAMGADCYLDARKYPSGAYCQLGDFIQYNPYDGITINVQLNENDKEKQPFKSIPASSVLAIINDPQAVMIEVL